MTRLPTVRARRTLSAAILVVLLAGAMAGTGPAQAMAPTPVFAPYLNYDVGSAQSVAIGDFTGDGRNDVVISTEDSADMSQPNHVYLFAQGPDGWLNRVDVLETRSSWMPDLGLAAGDLDGDGKTDAVVANGHALDLFFQRDGSLAAGTPIALEGAQSVKAVDVDGDGKVDLVSSATSGLLVLKGLGAGTFAPPVVVTPQRQVEVEVGDVTGDGRRDLVTCNGMVALMFAQQAGGTFAAPTQHSADVQCESVALADVNGDGRTDVAIVGGGNRPQSRLNVFPQLAGGSLAETPATYPTNDIPRSVKAGDMNGDGRADLVVAHDGWMSVGVHAQAPDHGLDPERLSGIPYNNRTSPHKMAIGDVNGDQRPDIVVAGDQHGLVLLWGQPAGPSTTTSTARLATTVATTPAAGAPRPLFSAPQAYDLDAIGESVVAGDFNGDGRTDVALSTRSTSNPTTRYKVFVFYQAADGSLPRAVSFDTEGGVGAGDVMVLSAGDLDGDGRTDLVLRMREGINLFMQRNGTFADRTYTELPYASRVDLADLDGDGKADMVMTGSGITVYRSLGAGKFAAPVTVLASTHRTRMAIGDMTGDGRLDLVTVNNFASPSVEVYRQLPDGAFGAAEHTAFDANPNEIALGDLNGDGRLDVAATYEAGIQVVGVRLLLQTAAGTLAPGATVEAYAAGPLRTGDVDGDGRSDLVAMYGTQVGVRLQQPGGQLGAEQSYAISGGSNTPSTGAVLADFTGDRRLDIAAANFAQGLDVLRNTSTGVPPPLAAASGAFHPLTPQRILDTRTGLGAPAARLGPGATATLQATGVGGVPDSGVSAVVLNVTVTEPTAPSFLTASPAGEPRPLASNLNYVAGQTVPNLVVVKVGTGGKVELFNGSGSAHVIADVAGWYGPESGAPGGRYNAVTPARILDTRSTSKLGQSAALGLQVTGHGGVPATGVSAVVLNVTVTEPTAISFLTAWPAGEARPLASNLNYVAGQTVPNLVVVKVGTGGKVELFNNSGAAHVVADVAGWYGTSGGGLFTPVTPARLADTRAGAKVGPAGTLALQVTGRGGVPASGVSAVVLNVTATEPTALGFLTAWPAGESRPLASNLNFSAAQTVPNLVVVKVGAGGVVNLFNSSGSTHVVADVAGWYA